jgi:hypothetical protein
VSRPCPKPNKGAYSTYKRAKQAAAIRSRKSRVKLGTYRCPKCRMFHLTSQVSEPATILSL